jgi:branched-chain amino acid transport system permease protein
MTRNQLGLIAKFEKYIDPITFHIYRIKDVVGESLKDFHSYLFELAELIKFKSATFLARVIVQEGSRPQSIFAKAVKVAVAVPVLAVIWFAIQFYISTIGTMWNLFGLRSGRDYTFKENLISWAPLLLLGVLMPWVGFKEFGIGQMILFFSYSIVIGGLVILFGVSGLPSLGHGAFVVLGGYVTAIIANAELWYVPTFVAILGGGLFASMIGGVVGIPASRVKGPYLALLTMGLMYSIGPTLKYPLLRGWTNGVDGLAVNGPTPPALLSFVSQPQWMYYHALFTMIFMLIFAHIIIRRTKIGRALVAVRDGEERSNVLGINELRYKALSFALSAFFAGVGGGLLTLHSGYISPESATQKESIEYLLALVIGGRQSLFGAALGAGFLTYQTFFTAWLSSWIKNGDQLLEFVYGLVIVVMAIMAPNGIVGEISFRLNKKIFVLPVRRKHRRTPFLDYSLEEEVLVAGKTQSAPPL